MEKILSQTSSQIKQRLKKGKVTVTVVGLGWMGLSIACLYADAGAKVIGIDNNPIIVNAINKSECLINENGLDTLLKKNVKARRLSAEADLEKVTTHSNVIIITVPTSINWNKQADYSTIEKVIKKIGIGLNEGTCIIIESTCAPGVTENLIQPLLEKYSGLKAELDFGLAYSPIRAMIGQVLSDIQQYPKIVGGVGPKSLKTAKTIIEIISKKGIIETTNARTAEAAKIFETVYRDVNIALANEFAKLCENMKIDYFEAAAAANTQPYSHLHTPGVGVGGHCLPVYSYLLLTQSHSLGAKMTLVKEARKINENMPRHTFKLTSEALRKCNRSIARARISILGIAYRPNIKEHRYSPSLELINILKKRGARIVIYDPLFNEKEIGKLGYNSKPTLQMSLNRANCAIITVAHNEFKQIKPKTFATSMSSPAAIIDGTGIYNPEDFEKKGFIFRGIGRGIWTR